MMKNNRIFDSIMKNTVQKEIKKGMEATSCPLYWSYQIKRPQNDFNLHEEENSSSAKRSKK